MLPSLRRWILAVAVAVLAVAGICGGTGRAATVVLANHAGAKVHFTIVPPGGKPEARNIAAGDVLSLSAEGELGIAFESEGLPRRYLVPANSIQYFVRRDGRLDLTQLALPAVGQNAWPPAAAAKPLGEAAGLAKSPGSTGNTVTIPVMILVDQHEPAVRQVWEKRLRDRLQEASAVIERCCGVRFEVVAVDTWRSNDANVDVAQALSDFESRVRPAPARLAIGFSSYAKLPAGPMPVGATPGPLHSHILVREGANRAGQVELLRILIHELGHFLGAVHSIEENSVMRPLLRDPRANARDFRLGFDPLNTLAMNVVVDELRSRPMHALADVRPETKVRLRGIYKVLGELLPNDRLAQNYLTLLNPPNLPPIVAATPRAERSERFWALFHDGSHVTAAKFGNYGWWSDDATLGGRRLFGTGNPVRMLRNTTLSRSLKAAHIVLASGDVLPGRVVKFLPPSPHNGLPARLLISPDLPLVTADPQGLEVRADRVLRLAAAPHRRIDGEPGTLVSTDGARVIATALHWTEQGVQVLTKDGIVTKSFPEIADLCVPGVDVLDAVLDDGRYPPLGSDAIVARLETVDGAVLTYHREMTLVAGRLAFQPGRAGRTMPCLHLQPSWSVDAILVPIDSIWRQSFRAANEVPLSHLPATVLKQRAGVHLWPWRRNQNVEGDPLWSGHITVDLGVGTHPYCEIAFDLPPSPQEFSTLIGLDRSVGRGACATGKIYRDQVSGEPLFSSGFLRGGGEPVPAGPLRLTGTKRLVLVTDFGDENRPPGADPFDIGDHVDWLMPFVSFEDSAQDRWRSLKRFVPGWEAWDIDVAEVGRLSVVPHWDADQECWRPVVRVTEEKPLVLSRTVARVTDANHLVELVLAHAEDLPTAKIDLRVDGVRLEPVAVITEREADPPAEPPSRNNKPESANARSRGEPAGAKNPQPEPVPSRLITVRWDLLASRQRAAQLALTIAFDKHPSGLRWHGLTLKSGTNTPPVHVQPDPHGRG